LKISKTSVMTFAMGAALAVLPAMAMAAGGGEGAHGDQQGLIAELRQGKIAGVVAILVFLTAFAILALKVWPVITKGLQDREDKIREEIEGAEMARKQAKDALEQYQQSLAQARAEAQKEIDKARAQAQVIAAELKAKADVELNAMREKAMRDIDNAKKAAVAEVYSQSAQLATTMAGKILRRDVNAGDTQRLLDESVAQLAGSRN
jgi:F-type H+-transporting ATPase subunit b